MGKTFLTQPDSFSRVLLISSVLLLGQGRTTDWPVGCRRHSNTDNYHSPEPTSQINSSNQWSKLSFIICTEPVGVKFGYFVPCRHSVFQNYVQNPISSSKIHQTICHKNINRQSLQSPHFADQLRCECIKTATVSTRKMTILSSI